VEISSFAEELLAELTDADRAIALEHAEDYVHFDPCDVAVIAGVLHVRELDAKKYLDQVMQVISVYAEGIKNVRELSEVERLYSDAHDNLIDSLLSYASKKIRGASERGKAASNARHAKPNGTREKRLAIQRIWASGKYKNRDLCAEQECAHLDMSFSTARRALRNIPRNAPD
jgi:hypothetical protein